MSSRRLMGWTFIFAAALTLAVALLPFIRFVYRSESVQIALETTIVLVGLLAALIVFGRFRQRGALQDLAVVYVLVILAFTSLVFGTIPSLLELDRGENFLAWTQATARLVALTILAAASFGQLTRVRNRSVGGVYVVAASVFTVFVIGGVALAAASYLPDAVDVAGPVADEVRPNVDGHPVFLALQLGQMALFGVAAWGFWKRGEQEAGPMTTWLAAGCVLAAFARLNYFLLPTLYTDYVYVGDVLRLGFYMFLLTGGVQEIRTYWLSLADAAVTEERRRVARDLHDGLAQELVFITAQTRRFLSHSPQARDLERLSSAADRAVAESRRAINALSAGRDQRLDEVLTEMAEETSRRVGVNVSIDVEAIEVPADSKETLIRVAREALMNSIRHGTPERVRIELENRDGLRMRIADDGSGFDQESEAAQRSGFGLISMKERVEAVGGTIEISSRPGSGTEIVIEVPESALQRS
ncbi:MAG TPA: ATP-binding protein [Actinomycetota bacterium]|nr:ATP-binding protein [Actinomycetota bacterium]